MSSTARDSGTVEQTVLHLPVTENGVSRLGDLYNCRTSGNLAQNLFAGNLSERHVEISSTQSSNFTLRHVRDAKDKLELLHVDAYVSFDLQSGLLKVAGGASFDEEKQKGFKEEHVVCELKVNTFTLRLRPEHLTQIMVDVIKEGILNGEIEATHFVGEIRLGADLLGSVQVSERLDDSKFGLTGEFDGKFTINTPIPITIGIRASLEWLEENGSSHYSTRVELVSRPNHGQVSPTTVTEMFKCIDGIDAEIRKPYDYLIDDSKQQSQVPYGVPIRFTLIPISSILDPARPPTYKLMDDETRDRFLDMLLNLWPITLENHVKGLIVVKDPRLVTIFETYTSGGAVELNRNPLTLAVSTYEEDLASTASNLRKAADKILTRYKQGQADTKDITQIIGTYEAEFSLAKIQAQVNAFLVEGKKILATVHAMDAGVAQKVDVFLKSEGELSTWFKEGAIKILLCTRHDDETTTTDGVFLKLYSMIPVLESVGVQVRVAFPNITPNSIFSLTIKIGPTDTTYEGPDIRFFLDILSVMIGSAGHTSQLFFSALVQLSGEDIQISKGALTELPKLVSLLKAELVVAGDDDDGTVVSICETYPQFLESLAVLSPPTHAGGAAWTFVLPIQGCKSAHEIVWSFKQIKAHNPTLASRVRWMVANLAPAAESKDCTNAPLILVFLNGLLRAVCLDNLDVYILTKLLTDGDLNTADDASLTPLLPSQIVKKCFHPGRAKFCLQIMQRLNVSCCDTASDDVDTELSSFPDVQRPSGLEDALDVIQVCAAVADASTGVTRVASAIAILCLEDFPHLIGMLKRHGWSDATGFHGDVDSETWRKLSEELDAFIPDGEVDPFNLIALKDVAVSLASDSEVYLQDICLSYCSSTRIVVEESYPEKMDDVRAALGLRQFYKALGLLAQRERHPMLFKFISDLSMPAPPSGLLEFRDPRFMRRILLALKADYAFTEDNLGDIWRNPKFAWWMSQGIENDALVETVAEIFCQEKIPQYIPLQLVDKIREMGLFGDRKSAVGNDDYDWDKAWASLEDVEQAFQNIVTRQTLPKNFSSILRLNLEQNASLRAQMRTRAVLFYWNEAEALLLEPWTIDTIGKVLLKLKEPQPSTVIKQTPTQGPPKDTPVLSNVLPSVPSIPVNETLAKFTGGTLTPLTSKGLQNLDVPLEHPFVELDDLSTTMAQILPYLVQQVRTGSTTGSLHPTEIANYINYWQGNDGAGHIPMVPPLGGKYEAENRFLLSRTDLLTTLLTAADPILSNYILRHLASASAAHSALPFIIPDITVAADNSAPDFVPVRLVSRALSATVKPFSHPCRLIVAIRAGAGSGPESPLPRLGKSSILNQTVMADIHYFASREEPGANFGAPLLRKGLVEVGWLTPESCSRPLWEHVGAVAAKVPVLLANVHGNAMAMQNILRILCPATTCFLVFWTANTWHELKAEQKKLQGLLGTDSPPCLHMVVDPNPSLAGQVGLHNTLRTRDMASEVGKMVSLMGSAISHKMGVKARMNRIGFELETPMGKAPPQQPTSVPSISTPESRELLKFVETQGVKEVKVILAQQHIQTTAAVALFRNLLCLPLAERNMGLSHLTTQLDNLSASSSVRQLHHLLKLETELEVEQERIKPVHGEVFLQPEAHAAILVDIKFAQANLDDSQLGLNDFFKATLANCTDDHGFYFLKIQEFMQAGFPFPLFNWATNVEKPFTWEPALQHCFHSALSDTRVAILSVIGLRTTFKSRLLNNLFGQSFREMRGGCTKGIVCRLLALEPQLTEELRADAILLLDVEGLRAPHNLLDQNALRDEKLLTAFVLGISHLTLVMGHARGHGQGLGLLKDVLAGGLTSLLSAKVSTYPDVLLIENGEDDLTDFVQNLKVFYKGSDFEIGATNDTITRLDNIKYRLASPRRICLPAERTSEIYDEFKRTFRNASATAATRKLGDWYDFSTKYLESILLTSRPRQPDQLADVKGALEAALRKHSKKIEVEYLDSVGKEGANPATVLRRLNRVPYVCDEGIGDKGSPCSECTAVIELADLGLEDGLDLTEFRAYRKFLLTDVRDKCFQMGFAKELNVGLRGELSVELDAILEEQFEDLEVQWVKFKQVVSTKLSVVPNHRAAEADVRDEFRNHPEILERLPTHANSVLPCLDKIAAFEFERKWAVSPLNYTGGQSQTMLDWKQNRWLVIGLEDACRSLVTRYEVDVYQRGLIRALRQQISTLLANFEKKYFCKLLPGFRWEAHFYAVLLIWRHLQERGWEWAQGHGLLNILEHRRYEFPLLFQSPGEQVEVC